MNTGDAKNIVILGYLKKEVVTQGKKTLGTDREEERKRHILKYSSRACGFDGKGIKNWRNKLSQRRYNILNNLKYSPVQKDARHLFHKGVGIGNESARVSDGCFPSPRLS